jgi:PTS system ascorbate-specific IIA component
MGKLKEMLTKDTIALNQSAKDWEEAVKIGSKLLVNIGVIKESYIDGIIECTHENGPYYVMAPGLAMPHARPEAGVIKTGFSLITLDKPVEFGHEGNDPVDTLITLAAEDNESHMEAIQEVVMLFSDEEAFEIIRNAEDIQEVLDLLND